MAKSNILRGKYFFPISNHTTDEPTSHNPSAIIHAHLALGFYHFLKNCHIISHSYEVMDDFRSQTFNHINNNYKLNKNNTT